MHLAQLKCDHFLTHNLLKFTANPLDRIYRESLFHDKMGWEIMSMLGHQQGEQAPSVW
jgi:hypothetical protein